MNNNPRQKFKRRFCLVCGETVTGIETGQRHGIFTCDGPVFEEYELLPPLDLAAIYESKYGNESWSIQVRPGVGYIDVVSGMKHVAVQAANDLMEIDHLRRRISELEATVQFYQDAQP